ncbi:Hsp70-Hsp90 organizing protein 2 [Raphanus sativus]|nr:Hsp70-Hsp90 organizing protein 2 [Raphanus sativus]
MTASETKGDRFFSSNLHMDAAVKSYTTALNQAPDDHHLHVLYSKRSAAHLKDKKYEEALADAKLALHLKPEWAEAHSRVAAAHYALGNIFFKKAKACYVSADSYADNYQFSDALDQLSKYRWSPFEEAFKKGMC